MKSFATACLASLAVAETLIQSGVGADQSDAALTAVFAAMPGQASGDVFLEGKDAAAHDAAVSLNDWFLATAKPMGKVCDAGLECREKQVVQAVVEVEEQWKLVLEDIQGIFDKSFTRSQNILETAYDKAKQCAPGCVCESITVEYADIVRQ